MKKLLALILTSCICLYAGAQFPEGYYSAVDGQQSADAVLDALQSCIKDHTVISYSSLDNYFTTTDSREDGTIWDIYSTCSFTMDNIYANQSALCDGWNKEDVVPKSWFDGATPIYSDLFHTYPSDSRMNTLRTNYLYGEVDGDNGTGITNDPDGHALGKLGTNTFPGYSGKVFEPADEYKGDLARTYFYMVARYRDNNFTNGNGAYVFTSNKTNLTSFATELFIKWHRQDPVSQKEVDRNNAIYSIQNNRNPFIDYPYLAEYIWGERAGETVDMSLLLSSSDSAFVLGQSNGLKDDTPQPIAQDTITRTLYLHANGIWDLDGADHFAVWHWQTGKDGAWSDWMTWLGGSIWMVDISRYGGSSPPDRGR